jgi:hypothetical protein
MMDRIYGKSPLISLLLLCWKMRKECEQFKRVMEPAGDAFKMGILKFPLLNRFVGAWTWTPSFWVRLARRCPDESHGNFPYKYSLNIHGQNSSQLFCFFCPVNFSKMANSTIFFTVGLLLAIIAFNEFQTAQADPSELPSLKVKM